jgi:predicted SAM-dependent methyltransferase
MIEGILRKISSILGKHSLAYTARKEEAKQAGEYERLASEHGKDAGIRLHFGCGPRVLKGWINIDLKFVPYGEYLQYYGEKYYPEAIRGDRSNFYALDIVRTGLPFADNSVDLIFHEDFLEHIDQKEQVVFLAETLRVLKPGSTHRVNTPNLLSAMQGHSDFARGKKGVYVHEWESHVHKSILTPASLEEMARMVGYKAILTQSRDKSTAKGLPLEYRPSSEEPEERNIFADLIK